MNQSEYDSSIDILRLNEIKYAKFVALLRRRNDPAAFNKEEYLMMFDNVLYALRDYDITTIGVLTDTEISYLFELGNQLSLNWH
jgi:hypothetical protein